MALGNVPFFDAILLVWREKWFLLASGFAAGLVDSIGGGGGLITVPAFLTAGLPNEFLLGTNKCMSALGTSVAVARYGFAGLLPRITPLSWLALICAAMVFAAFGAALSQFAFVLDHLHILIPVMLFAVMGFLLKRWFWEPRHFAHKNTIDKVDSQAASAKLQSTTAVLTVGAIGGYDGLFGPGAGTFYLSFLESRGFSTVNANAITKILNLSSNLGALAYFAFSGRVIWPVGVAVAAGYMGGNYLGSGLVLKNGQALVRVTVLSTTTLMLLRYAWLHW